VVRPEVRPEVRPVPLSVLYGCHLSFKGGDHPDLTGQRMRAEQLSCIRRHAEEMKKEMVAEENGEKEENETGGGGSR
jgi:hypothetical protein